MSRVLIILIFGILGITGCTKPEPKVYPFLDAPFDYKFEDIFVYK